MFKKLIIATILTFLPLNTFAAWWNPFSWKKSNIDVLPKSQIEKPISQEKIIEKIVEKPVIQEKIIEKPVIQERIIEKPIIREKIITVDNPELRKQIDNLISENQRLKNEYSVLLNEINRLRQLLATQSNPNLTTDSPSNPPSNIDSDDPKFVKYPEIVITKPYDDQCGCVTISWSFQANEESSFELYVAADPPSPSQYAIQYANDPYFYIKYVSLNQPANTLNGESNHLRGLQSDGKNFSFDIWVAKNYKIHYRIRLIDKAGNYTWHEANYALTN